MRFIRWVIDHPAECASKFRDYVLDNTAVWPDVESLDGGLSLIQDQHIPAEEREVMARYLRDAWKAYLAFRDDWAKQNKLLKQFMFDSILVIALIMIEVFILVLIASSI